MGMRLRLLERALEADERAEKLQQRVTDLEQRLRAALNADPTTASRALSWVGRAEEAEKLLGLLMHFIDQRSVETRDFPPGWVERARSQLRSVDILNRDLQPLAERPDDSEGYWQTTVDSSGRRGIVRDP